MSGCNSNYKKNAQTAVTVEKVWKESRAWTLSVSPIYHLVDTPVRSSYLSSCTCSSVSPALCNCLVTCQRLATESNSSRSRLHQLGAVTIAMLLPKLLLLLLLLLGSCSLRNWFLKKVENCERGYGQSQNARLSASRRSIPSFHCNSDI